MGVPTEPVLDARPVAAARPAAAAPSRGAAPPRGERAQRLGWGAVGVLVTLALLEGVARSGAVDARFVPPPSDVARAGWALLADAGFWSAAWASFTGWALGYGLAATGGIALGIVCGAHPAVRAFTASTIDFLRPVPSVAFIPVVVLLFGSAAGSKVTLVVYAAIWPVVIQVIYGIADVDPVARYTARSLRMSALGRLRHLVWPSALPSALTGLRLAASTALVVCVAAELIIGVAGIGDAIARAKDAGAYTRMYALIAAAGVAGVTINAGLGALQRWALRHHSPDRAGRPA